MKYLVLDIETESKEYRKRFADPFEEKNEIVMMQAKTANWPPITLYKKGRYIPRDQYINFKDVNLLVGQNIRFDLLYLWNNTSLQNWLKSGGQIWDTKVIEYLINGQNKSVKYSLDELSVKYGGQLKPNDTKDLYKEGYTTTQIIEKIGIDRFKVYAEGDVLNTEKVFQGQYLHMKHNNLSWLFKTYMTHYLAMLEIEANGLYVDKPRLQEINQTQIALVANTKAEVENLVINWANRLPFDINSPEHVSAALFGGKFIILLKKPELDEKTNLPKYYKTGTKAGQVRYRNYEHEVKVKGYGLSTYSINAMKKKGVYATGDVTLKALDLPIAGKIRDYREQNKFLSTYSTPFLDLINPYTNCIHSEFNLAGTRTGRLSSKAPNVQNLHPRLLECFKSRFQNGTIIEFDWKQLEVVLAALLSRDQILLTQLANNIDMHYINAMGLFDKTEISPAERKLAKFLTFGILYGSGYKSMAIQHSIEEELAADFISQFYDTYPMIKQWHDNLQEEAKQNEYQVEGKVYSFLRGYHGKKYHLEAYPAKFDWQIRKGITHSFLPTEIKNYPVQGFASIVMSFFAGKVYKFLQNHRSSVKLINEVHDSLILDCSPEGLEDIENSNFLEQIVMETNDEFKAYYNDKPLLILEHKMGKTWGDCKK